MKALYTSLIVSGLLALTGCNTSSTGGSSGGSRRATSGTGATTSTHREASTATFKLSGPSNLVDTKVKQGETVTKDITIDTGKDFAEDLTFEAKVEPADKGVTAKIEPTVWKASGDKKVKLSVTASDKAAKAEYAINIVGKPTKGEPNPPLVVKVKVP